MTRKILVTGFPHCGTTILRAKIGECKSIYDQHREFGDPSNYNPNSPYKWFVWKHPFLHKTFRNDGFINKPNSEFSETIVIPIIRNPWFVFSSILKRSDISYHDIKKDGSHSLDYYFNAAQRILEAFNTPCEDVYPIKYEDMFGNNFKQLRIIFDKIGLEYDDNIFTTKSRVYKNNDSNFVENYNETKNYDGDYRVWQINQKFENMNNSVDLPDEISELLSNNVFVKRLGYTDPRVSH